MMLVFARFVLRDSGLPIMLATQHVTQVRLTIDGEPAIYILNKETPVIVEGTLESAIKKLEAAGAGLRVVEPEPQDNVVQLDAPFRETPPVQPIVAAPTPVAEPAPVVAPVAHLAKLKPKAKPESAKAKAAPAKTTKVTAIGRKAKKPAATREDDDLNWFKGLS
jgi:hypothetical protein